MQRLKYITKLTNKKNKIMKKDKLTTLLISYNRFNNGHSVVYVQSERFNFNKKIYLPKRKENKEKYFNLSI